MTVPKPASTTIVPVKESLAGIPSTFVLSTNENANLSTNSVIYQNAVKLAKSASPQMLPLSLVHNIHPHQHHQQSDCTIVVMGASHVGKTAVIRRFVFGRSAVSPQTSEQERNRSSSSLSCGSSGSGGGVGFVDDRYYKSVSVSGVPKHVEVVDTTGLDTRVGFNRLSHWASRADAVVFVASPCLDSAIQVELLMEILLPSSGIEEDCPLVLCSWEEDYVVNTLMASATLEDSRVVIASWQVAIKTAVGLAASKVKRRSRTADTTWTNTVRTSSEVLDESSYPVCGVVQRI